MSPPSASSHRSTGGIAAAAGGPFRLGEARVDPARNRVERGGRWRRVEPKVMRVLLFLAGHSGEVLSKEAILAAVWGRDAVGDEVLTRSISELRRALGDDPRAPRFIETIYKTGYRLMLAPQAAASDASGPIPPPPGRSARGRPFVLGAVPVVVALLLLALDWRRETAPEADPPPGRASSGPRPFDERDLIPITTFPGHEYASPFSPDSEKVAIVWEGPGGGTNYDIYVKRLDQEEPLRLTASQGSEGHPAWAPDGEHLGYVRGGDDGGIFVAPLIGGAERRLLDRRLGPIEGISFSPDGHHLVFAAGPVGGQPCRLYRLSLATLEVETLTAPPAGSLGDFAPAVSPDGRLIAFERILAPLGDQDLYLIEMPAAGVVGTPLEARRLTADRQTVSGQTWLADGSGLVFASRRAGYSQLWSIDLDGTLRRLSGSLSRLIAPSASPDGRYLAFTRKVVEQNIWLASLDGDAPPRRLVASTHLDLSPVFSPDGARVAFISYRSGHPELWSSDGAGGNLLRLTRFEGPLVRFPRWSPAGDRLAVEVTWTGRTEVHVVRADGPAPSAVAVPAGDAGAGVSDTLGSWSPDGRSFYFASNRSRTWQVWRRPDAGGAAEQVTIDGGYASQLTERGLFFTKHGVPGLWQRHESGERLVLAELSADHFRQWTVQGGALYYVTPWPDLRLLRRELDAGTETELLRFERLGWEEQAFSLDPRGGRVVLGQCDRIESDIWMVELGAGR